MWFTINYCVELWDLSFYVMYFYKCQMDSNKRRAEKAAIDFYEI